MNKIVLSAALMSYLAVPALADGDADAGEGLFNRCKSCHTIADGDNILVRGGRTGPNLFGVIGRQAGSVDDFRYGASIVEAGEAGLVWDQESLTSFVTDPNEFLGEYLDDSSARAKMTFRLREGGEDIAAFLATFSPEMEDMEDAE